MCICNNHTLHMYITFNTVMSSILVVMFIHTEFVTDAKNRFLLRRFKVCPPLWHSYYWCDLDLLLLLLYYHHPASRTGTGSGRAASPGVQCWSGPGPQSHSDASPFKVCLLHIPHTSHQHMLHAPCLPFSSSHARFTDLDCLGDGHQALIKECLARDKNAILLTRKGNL